MASLSSTPDSISTSQIEILPQNTPFTSPIHSVKDSKDYNFYGLVSTLISKLPEAATFMTSNTNDLDPSTAHRHVLTALTTFLKDSHSSCQTPKQSCWFTIRMTIPTTEFKIPRWHQDGNFFSVDFPDSPDPTHQPRSKYATTLLGPHTLLLNTPHTPSLLTYLNSRDNPSDFFTSAVQYDNLPLRQKVDDYFRELGLERINAQPGQIVRFAWGSDYAAVHSEPDMSFDDRVFVSVLFGSETEIRHMCDYREVVFLE